MSEKLDAAMQMYNILSDDYTKLQADYRHLHSNFEHLRTINAVLRSRPDLPVDRLPAIEEMARIYATLTLEANKANAERDRVTHLHKQLMKAADERLDFTLVQLQDACREGSKLLAENVELRAKVGWYEMKNPEQT